MIFLCFIALIQLSRLTVDSSTYIEYVLVGIVKFLFFKGAYGIKDIYAVYALKILCSEYDVCRKSLYDFLVQNYKPVLFIFRTRMSVHSAPIDVMSMLTVNFRFRH